jgi:lipid-A-disaccharide synthase
MSNTNKQVLIVAGEASGDHHAARLVEELHQIDPSVHFAGIGGERMKKAGVEILVDSADMAVVGLVEVLANYRFLKGVLDQMRDELRQRRPDMLILVDYPDFNLRLAKTAKELGIKVLYYISPQIWAWRQKRVFKIKKLVDMMAVVFPFEVPFYEQAGVPVRFVGHPLVDEVRSKLSHEQAEQEFGLDSSRPVLGLFPGSRRSEIKRLLPILLESAALVHKQRPDVQFILPRASTLSEEFLTPYLSETDLDIHVIPGRSYDVTRACDAIVSASGTATLEIALMQVPLVVIYKIASLSYRIVSRMLKIDHVALCNIVAGERVVPELIQHDATPQRISHAALELLTNNDKAAAMRQHQEVVREKLGGSGGSRNVAELALELLNN